MNRYISLLLLIVATTLSAQETLSPDSVFVRLEKQANLFPNEKIYLHTDRSLYAGGDTIWFRSYLVNALDHLPAITSRYVYVELVNPSGEMTTRIKVKQDKAKMFYGFLPLGVHLTEGVYLLRAYTRYMENNGVDYFYRKPIRIVSPLGKSEEVDETKEKEGIMEDYYVDFLPEGGNLLAGVQSNMAFKVLNLNGLSEDISGVVRDEAGTQICSFQTAHKGMGAFSWKPEADKKYYATCISTKGIEKRFELPLAETSLYTLNVKESDLNYHVFILYPCGVATDEPLTLLIHQRGYPLFVQSFQATHRVSVAKKAFSPGIIHLLLLSSQGKILSERQIFVKPDKQATATVHTDKKTYISREKVRLDIALKDAKGKPVQGDFSMAVIDRNDILPDTIHTILTSLLLSSELKGYIEDPGWYFRSNDSLHNAALDLLMLTQGWRKYDVESALAARYKLPSIFPETGQEISGTVKALVANRVVEQAKIQFYVPTQKVLEEFHAGKEGKFKIDHFEFPDSTVCYVQATTKKNGKNVLLSLVPEVFPGKDSLSLALPDLFSGEKKFSLSENTVAVEFKDKAYRRMQYENGMRNIFLEDVVVTAKKKKVKRTPFETIPSTITIKEEDIKDSPMMELPMFLNSRLPGLIFTPQGIFRSRDLGDKKPEPKPVQIILNGFPIYDVISAQTLLETLQMKDIAQIDYNREVAAGLAWFSMTGASFIAITLKDDIPSTVSVPKNMKQVQLLGFQKPAFFYSPQYETTQLQENTSPDLRTTIYWNPNLQVNWKGKAAVDFYTTDAHPPYSVIIEGITSNGELLRRELVLELFDTSSR